MKIGVITSAPYAIPVLQLLAGNRLQASVFADATSNKDNLTHLKFFCEHASLPYTEQLPGEVYGWAASYQPDVIFIIGHSHLIDVTRIATPLINSVYNIHFSALPDYRGANPVFWQMKEGAETLAVSIHRISDKFDKGPLIWTKEMPRASHIGYGMAHTMLGHQAVEGVVAILQQHLQKQPVVTIPYTTTGKYYPKPGLKDVMIDWQEMAPQQIINLVLACNPWNKGALTTYNGAEVKIVDAELSKDKLPGNLPPTPGTIANHDKCLHVVCKGNKLLSITMLTLDGNFVPARHAEKYRFLKGQRLGS